MFKAEGLDVEVKEGKGSATSVKLVASGDTFIGSADLGTALKSMVKGIPVKAVFGELQDNPMAVISLASNPIRTPKELEGKRIVSLAPGSYTKILPVLCSKNGVDCKKINLRFTRPPYQKFLIGGQADGFLGYFTDNVPKLDLRGHKAYAMMYKDFGVNLLSNGLIVTPENLKKRGDTIRRILRVVGKAWRDARDKPDEVVDAWAKVLGKEKRALGKRIIANSVSILHTPNTKGKPLGWMSDADWKHTQDSLAATKAIKKTMPVSHFYTNDLISDIR